MLYQQSGRLEEALQLELAVVAERERTIGLAHPDGRGSLNNLAEIYRGLRRPDEEATRRRKLAAVERAIGADGADARDARRELADFLRRSGGAEEADEQEGTGR